MTTIEQVRELAAEFLSIADDLNVNVSRYLDGSDNNEDLHAYETVRAADKKFIDAINDFYGENDYEYGLNYAVAESVLPEL